MKVELTLRMSRELDPSALREVVTEHDLVKLAADLSRTACTLAMLRAHGWTAGLQGARVTCTHLGFATAADAQRRLAELGIEVRLDPAGLGYRIPLLDQE